MNEEDGRATKSQLSSGLREPSHVSQSVLIHEQLPMGEEAEANQDQQQQNLVIELQHQLLMKDEIIKILKEENKLQKGKLRGFETLANLYQQSKNECNLLTKQCTEQKNEIEGYKRCISVTSKRSKGSSFVVQCSANVSHKDSDSEEAVLQETKLSTSSSEGFEVLPSQDTCIETLSQMEGSVESCHPESETVEILETTEIVDRAANEGCARNQSDFSFLDIRTPLDSSLNEIVHNNCGKTNNAETSEKLDRKHPELLGPRELFVIQQHLVNPEASQESRNFLKELLSVGLKVINLNEQIQAEESDCLTNPFDGSRKLPSSSSKVVTAEVQILREQVMTFKDDFDRERKDRMKARLQHDQLKSHFDRLSVDFLDLKNQLRAAKTKLAPAENAKPRHQISKTTQKLRYLNPGFSIPPNPRPAFQQINPSGMCNTWPCMFCTYENPSRRKTCELCGVAAVVRNIPRLSVL